MKRPLALTGLENMTDEAFEMTEDDWKMLYETFSLNAEAFIAKTGARDYKLNDDAFADAIIDIEQDLQIIVFRRLKHVAATGMSRGKVAGIYAFRLSRASIINFCPGKVQTHHKHDKTVNAAIALKTAFDAIKLPLKEIKPAILRELIYNLRKWHMNQETLALVIDSICMTSA